MAGMKPILFVTAENSKVKMEITLIFPGGMIQVCLMATRHSAAP